MKFVWLQRTIWVFTGFVCVLFGVVAFAMFDMFNIPGKSFKGELPPLGAEDKRLSERLKRHVLSLASEIGDRNYLATAKLAQAADYIDQEFTKLGYKAKRQVFSYSSIDFQNIYVELKGKSKPDEVIVFGAHYDTVTSCPGANDNASGVAAVIELARLLRDEQPERTVRFVAFPNEEHFFRSEGMGSYHYAKMCREKKDNILAMYSLETIGCYSNERESQKYPPGIGMLYPDTGNFIAFVSNYEYKDLLKRSILSFRQNAQFPSEGLAAPSVVPGIDWSDHLQFWAFGYPALMITDTAPYRYADYHLPSDTVDKIDFDSMARVVRGLVNIANEI